MIFLSGFRDMASTVTSLRARKASLKSEIEELKGRLKTAQNKAVKQASPPKPSTEQPRPILGAKSRESLTEALTRVTTLTNQLKRVREIRQELHAYQEQLDQAIAEITRVERL